MICPPRPRSAEMRVSRAFAKRTIAAEGSCTTGVLTEGRMAGGVASVWERK